MTALAVRDVVALYLRHSKATGLHGPEALAERERTLGWFVKDLGGLLVAEAKPFHLSDWIEAHEGWRSVSTRRAKANQVRAAFEWAFDTERIERNPFRKVRYPEAERRPELPDSCLKAVCVLGNKHFERAARWLRLTGCRLSELCRATWADVDLERGIWTITKHKSKRYTGKAKVLSLCAESIELLHAMASASAVAEAASAMPAVLAIKGHAERRFIFTNTRGTPWTRRTLGQSLARLKERHGIQTAATLHGIRHRAASAALAAGASLKLVSIALGHASSQVTERYYAHSEGMISEAGAALAKGLPK